ncbi:MAG TPA: DUF4276 family protein [Rhodopila sp.]|jgi:hypothetical protein
MLFVAPIVEGHGEEAAVPALLHRIAQQVGGGAGLRVNPPIRIKSGSFLNDSDYFRRYVTLAAEKAKNQDGVVLILLDADDDRHCPATLGPDLLSRAKGVRGDVPIIVSLAWREYETWFITAAQSLAGRHGLPPDLQPPPAPDGIRGAKEWLGQKMASGYDPITHQLNFTKLFDLGQARANRSFERLCRIIESLSKQHTAPVK